MVLICKGINKRSNINTYRNNLIKYNRVISTNTFQINTLENNITQINTEIYNYINKEIYIPVNINIDHSLQNSSNINN
jgi:hypothetical protein